MDGIMPTVVFFWQSFPILLFCAFVGFLVGYRDLPNKGGAALTMAVTVAFCTLASWLFFMPKGSDLVAHGMAILLSLALFTVLFGWGAAAGKRKTYPRSEDLGRMGSNWDPGF